MAERQKSYDLIGRSLEIEKMLTLAKKVTDDQRPVSILLKGMEGIGKTALMNYVATLLGRHQPPFVSLGVVSYRGMQTAFFPIDQMVMEILRLKPSMLNRPEEEILQMVDVRLDELKLMKNDVERSRHSKILISLIATAAHRDSDLDEEMTTPIEKYLFSVRRLLSLMAEESPVTLMLDDLHHYPAESLGLVRALRTGLMNKPVLWLFTSEVLSDEIKRISNEIIEVSPLSLQETGAYLRESLADLDPFPEDLVEVLYSTSRGVPGVLNHHVSLLIDNRVLELGGGRGKWSFRPDRLMPERLPIERDAVIDLRLKQLDDAEKQVLTLASLVGDVFWDDAILALQRARLIVPDKEDPAVVWPDDSGILNVQTILDGLCEKGFISRLESHEFYGVAEYSFEYEGLRDKLMAEVDQDTRSLYHMAAARWLEMVAGSRKGEYGEVIARHLELAGNKHSAAHMYVAAAKVAHGRYLFERAYDLYRKAMENLDESEAGLILEALHEMGNMAQARAKMDIALECFNRMLQVSWKCVCRSKGAAALSKIGRIHRQQGDFRAARAFLERSLGLFTQAADKRGVASTKDDLGTINFLQGNYEPALQLYNEALNLRLEMRDERGVALSYEHIGQIERANGNYDEAEKRSRDALEIRRKINDEEGMISALNLMGIIAFERGVREAAISIWKEALEHAVKISNLRMMEYLNNNIGEVFMEMGQFPVAESHFKQCMDIALLLSDKRAEAEVCRNLGQLYMKTGNVKAARDYLNRSTATARMIGSKEHMGLALRALGQLEGFSVFDETGGPAGAAESYFQEALDIFDSIGNESEFLRTMEIFGKFLFDHGRVEEAINVMERALGETKIKSEDIRNRLQEEIRKMKQFAAS